MEIEGYVSSPSRFGRLTKHIFDEYPVYQFNISPAVINHYFPDKLYAFPSTTCKSLVKRYILYSKAVVHTTRRQLSDQNESLSDTLTFTELLKGLLSENNSAIRYNFIVMDDCLIFIQIPSVRHVSYYALCKHIALSNRAKYVRFAGEMWCDEDNCLLINNNSGTYRPSDELIKSAVEFFDYLVPELPFEGISSRTSALPSIKRRCVTKIKQRLSLQHEAYPV